MAIGHNDVSATMVYNAAATGTKADVTTATKILVYSITIHNANAAEAYLQVFDAQSASVTVGTTAPTFVIGCDAATQIHCVFPKPILLGSGFTIASTTARAGATGATQEVTITYAA